MDPREKKGDEVKNQNATFNGTKKVAKTASYTALVTDEEINVTPAANSVITLPAIKDLAAVGFGAKAYLISKEGTGRYNVKVLAATGDFILVGGAQQDAIFLSSNGESVVVQSDPVSKNWVIGMQNMGMWLGVALAGRHDGNINIETNALTGQINGLEINMSGPNGAATGSNSYCVMRVNNNVVGTSIMTARTAFFGLYTHSTDQVVTGNLTAVEMEVGEAAAVGSQTTAVLTLCTRSARPSASYHELSAYITVRDYSTGSGGPLPGFLSLQNATLGWTIPSTSATALFTTYTHEVTHMGHALKIDVGGTPYWIVCTATAPH
jgi:hypothetical protein